MNSNDSLFPEALSTRVFLVIPLFDDAERLPGMLSKIAETTALGRRLEVLLIDDGSSDNTARIAMGGHPSLSVHLVQHFQSRGFGRAILTGLRQAARLAEPDDAVITMCLGNRDDLSLIPWMLGEISNGADVVLASQDRDGGWNHGAPGHRRILSKGASLLLGKFSGMVGVKNFASPFRAYRASLLMKATQHWGDRFVEENGWACMAEILFKIRHWNPVIRELPTTSRFQGGIDSAREPIFRKLARYFRICLRDVVSSYPVETPVRIYCTKTDTIEIQPAVPDVALHS